MKITVPSFQSTSMDQLALNAETSASIIGKLAFIGAIVISWNVGTKWDSHDSFKFPIPLAAIDNNNLPNNLSASLNSYSVISRRNIFGKNEQKKPTPAPVKNNKPQNLRLVGVYVKPGDSPFAIIEHTGKKEQDVFEINDIVYGSSTLRKVHSDKVILKQGSSTVILKLEEAVSSDSASGISSNEDGSEFSVSEDELTKALSNLPRLLSQARAVPYFRNGKSIGMRLFAIRKGSMYEKLGLKNGDIIKEVNENSLSDPSQALKLFNQLKDEKSISVVLERAGADKNLSYSIE